MLLDDRLIAEIARLEWIKVDGELGFVNLGAYFLTCYFETQATRLDHNGRPILERVLSAVVRQPRSSLTHPNGRRAQILDAQGQPVTAPLLDLMASMH